MSNLKKEVVIVSAARTPIGKHCGYYNDLSAEDLGVLAVKEAILRSGIDLSKIKIDQLIAGMIYIDSQNQQIYLPRNVAYRVAQQLNDSDNLKTAPGKTTLRICGTGFQTIADAFDLINAEEPQKMNCIISFACESMSQTNLIHQGRRKKDGVWEFDDAPMKDYLMEGFNHNLHDTLMPKTADVYGHKVGITRMECDEFSYLSHIRAKAAQEKQWNRFRDKSDNDYLKGVFTVDTVDNVGNSICVWRDEGTKYDISLDELKNLRPLLGPKGLVTPGTASQISDGAAAAVIMDKEFADRNNIPYLAKISGYQFSTVDPEIMGQGPVPAIKLLMEKLNLQMSDIDLFEVNEAFSVVPIVVHRELNVPYEKINVHGGAVALGHPIGASGARILTTLLYSLKRYNKKYGLATLCIGGGEASALIVEML